MIDKPVESSVSSSIQSTTFRTNLLTVAKGGGITFAGKLFLAATRMVTAVLLARLLGAEQYGMYSLALSTSTIAVGLAIFGLDSALVRYIAILANRKDEAGLWGALQISIGTAMFLSVVTGTGIYAMAYLIAERAFNAPHLAPLLQLIGVIVPWLVLSDVLAGANRGFKKMEYPVIAQSISQPIIRLLLIAILAFFGFNAKLAILTFGLADLAASFILLYFLNKEFPLKRPIRAARRDARGILSFSLPIWLSDLMLKFKNNLQTLFIGSLGTITGVGIFSVANQITTVSGEFSSAINTSSKPIIAELHDRGDLKQMGRIYQTTNKWNIMVQLPIFLSMVMFSEQILSIFGRSFTGGASALVILAVADLVSMGTGMGGIIIDMTGYTKLKLLNSIVRLILYLVLNFLFIPRWGIVGAALSVLIGEAVVNLLRLLEVYILYRILPYNKSFAKPVMAIAIAFASSALIGLWQPPGMNYLLTAFHLILIFAVYAASIFLLGLSSDERNMLAYLRKRVQMALIKS